MSFSPFDMRTPHFKIPSQFPLHDMIERMKTHLGHGYTRNIIAFSWKKNDDQVIYFLAQSFETNNKKGVKTTASCFLWMICNGFERLESFAVPDEVYKMDDGELRMILCPLMAETLKVLPKRLLAYLFTTNDVAGMDSFTYSRPPWAPRCIENYVMASGKSQFVQSHVRSMPPEELFNLYLTSRFIDSDTIADILQDLGNDERFQKRAPPGLSDEERKLWESDAIKSIRERMKAEVSPERFKELVGSWISRNLELSPNLDPVIYKDAVGRKLPMTPAMCQAWDKLSPLVFLFATSRFYWRSPADLYLALTAGFDGTWIAELTPKDQRWGVSPPNKKDLKWVSTTPEGLAWLLQALKTKGRAQEEFVAGLKTILNAEDISETRRIDEAVLKLTDGLDKYEHGILGLVKSIYLRLLTGEIKLQPPASSMANNVVVKPTVFGKILELLKENNIDWTFYWPEIEMVAPSDETDNFQLLESFPAA